MPHEHSPLALCSVDECGNKLLAKGLCAVHYLRRKHGRPLVTWREEFITSHPPRDGVGFIPLAHAQSTKITRHALVDADDYDRVMQYHWWIDYRNRLQCGTEYAAGIIRRVLGELVAGPTTGRRPRQGLSPLGQRGVAVIAPPGVADVRDRETDRAAQRYDETGGWDQQRGRANLT